MKPFPRSINSLRALLVLWSLLGGEVNAAPCCGGSSLLPTLITGDDVAQLGLGISHGQVVSDVLASGEKISRAADDKDHSEILSWQGAYLFSDRWQLGAEIPFHRRSLDFAGNTTQKTGVGDISLDVAYEFLPEREYSAWKPKGFVFTKMVLPTGTSIYETADFSAVHGKGFYSLALGVAFLKTISTFDFMLSGETHVNLPREFDESSGRREFGWGQGFSFLAAVGYSPIVPLRLGISVSPLFESGRTVKTSVTADTTGTRIWNLSGQVSWRITDQWTSSLTYNNQNWLGGHNTDLSWSAAVQIQRRFEL